MWVRQAAEVGKTHKLWFECRDAITLAARKCTVAGCNMAKPCGRPYTLANLGKFRHC